MRRLALRWLALASLALSRAVPRPLAAQAQGLGAGWSLAKCLAATTDRDTDGLDDDCETALARSFAPELLVDRDDCPWDGERTGLRGGYLYAVSHAGERVQLAYLPAYLQDCGWRGWPRVLRVGRSAAHAGDSEAILLEIQPGAGDSWHTTAIYLSAHCGGRSAGRCRWFRDDELAAFTWREGRVLGAPVVWVARDKHAHYPTRSSCESGHWRQERCAREPAAHRFPIESFDRNIGSARHPRPRARGCIPGSDLPLRGHVSAVAVECLWDDDAEFGGWQPHADGNGATAYSIVLRRAGFDPE